MNGCEFAFDNACDETRYGGGGYCAAGSDTADCAVVTSGRFDDSCRWAHDDECDEARFGGTGACLGGTDTSDCQGSGAAEPPSPGSPPFVSLPTDAEVVQPPAPAPPATGAARLGDDSCQYALDGRCDEPGFGTALYLPATDVTDCVGRPL